jgi:murein DD-endopeptidase MepM/ murein hydrolase activator NlpD
MVSSEKELINNEILKVITKESAKKMEKIAILYSNLDTKIKHISTLIEEIKNSKQILIKRKQEIALLKQKQYQYLNNLKKQKINYKKEIQKIIAEQTAMQNQLAKLKIIQKQEIEKAKEAVRLQKQAKKLSKAEKIKVKNYGNVYMKTKSARYKGAKTIPPLKKGKIAKRFGSYTDPIYHISLYNDSITFKVNKTTKIYSILDGKVVFVKKGGNNKMIVIQHNNFLHSIYAKLSLISPFIKKGYRVKKGEVIAKTDNELEFEVTYKTLPINPMQIIKYK